MLNFEVIYLDEGSHLHKHDRHSNTPIELQRRRTNEKKRKGKEREKRRRPRVHNPSISNLPRRLLPVYFFVSPLPFPACIHKKPYFSFCLFSPYQSIPSRPEQNTRAGYEKSPINQNFRVGNEGEKKLKLKLKKERKI